MSVAGFDFGNSVCVVALARRGGIDVVANEVSNRQTPTLVGFDQRSRHIGERAASQLMSNIKNTVSEVKRLLGRKFYEPELQEDLQRLQYKVVDIGKGQLGIQVNYLNEQVTFTPEKVAAMMLHNLKQIAEHNYGSKVSDCVISVPVYWTDAQRRALLDAAAIAQLNVLRLMNETTANALGWGLVKTDLPEAEPWNVVFVDMGHSSLQVSVVSFVKGKLDVKATVYDRNLGGRNFDDVLVNHFAAEWKAKHKIDIFTNAKAKLRTEVASEKLKKVLSANSEAPVNIECLMNDVDVRSVVKREDFEKMAEHLLQRVADACSRALTEAGLKKEDIYAVEMVGGSTRMPAVRTAVSSVFGKEASRTMNSEEAVARGCALQGAMLSPAFKVREFQVHEVYPYPVAFTWAKDPDAMATDSASSTATSVVFPKYNPLPSAKLLTFKKHEPFDVHTIYADPALLAPEVDTYIGKANISGMTDSKEGSIKVKVKLNIHGIVTVDSAELQEEVEVVEPPAPSPPPTAESPAPAAADAKAAPRASPAPSPPPAAPSADADAPMNDAEPKAEPAKKKKVKKTSLKVNYVAAAGMSSTDLQAAIEAEFKMELDDKVVMETQEKKNALEAYIYSLRSKLGGELASFVHPKDRDALTDRLQHMEDWLYDAEEDTPKGVYIEKYNELSKLGDPIVARHREAHSRPAAVTAAFRAIEGFRSFAASIEEKYAHIEQADRDKVVSECASFESWLSELVAKQEKLSQIQDPILLTADIDKKRESLEKTCNAIMNKKKPAPAKPKDDAGKASPKPEASPPPKAATPDAEQVPPSPEAPVPEAGKMDLD